MCGIRFCGWGWVPIRGFWHETHTKGLHARFPKRPEEDKERQQLEKGGRQARSLDLWTQRPSRLMQKNAWWLCENFAWIHTGDSQMHRKPQKRAWTSPFLHLELTQVRACLFFFLPPFRLCMLRLVCLQSNVKRPWPDMRETTRWPDGHGLV